MKWATYVSPSTGRPRAGVLIDGMLHGIEDDRPLVQLLAEDTLAAAAGDARRSPSEVVPVDDVRLLAPIPTPPSVRDFMSFEDHLLVGARAMGVAVPAVWYEAPGFYFSNPAAIRGPHDPVPVAPGSQAFDFELEVAAVIGTACSDVDPDEGERHIAGYLVMSDWSARDLQKREMPLQMGPSKGKDTATSLGGFLVTPDELEDVRSGKGFDLAMTASVNGRPYSEGNLKDLAWSFGEMVAHAARGTRLQPGDVIGSGTVATGCILELATVHGADRFPYLQPDDRVRLAVERLGEIDTVVEAGRPPLRLH